MNKNPFYKHKLRHYSIVYEDLVKKSQGKYLDFGTGNAEFIGDASKLKGDFYAFDVDKKNIKEAKSKYKDVRFKHIPVGQRLPYKNNLFDAVFMFHVLEHVDSEKRAIDEVKRIIKKGGTFYLASPYKGLFTWADTANIRYRFPRIHRFFSRLILGESEYKKRFIDKLDEKLYGDCSANRKWHKHYTEEEIRRLLKGFKIKKFYKFSLFHPFLLVLGNVFNFIFKRESKIIKNLIWLDNKIEANDFSYNILVVAEKK